MTGIIAYPERGEAQIQAGLIGSFDQVVSSQTREVAQRVQALRNHLSPAALKPQAKPATGEALELALFNALANVKMLTAQVAMHLDQKWRGKLFRQLDSLHDLAEWDADDEPIQQASFATFLKAILQLNPERRPGLGLSHAGNLIAAWTVSDDRLTIEFLPSERIRWVLSRRIGEESERFAGDTSVTRLAESLKAYNPRYWFSHEHHKPA